MPRLTAAAAGAWSGRNAGWRPAPPVVRGRRRLLESTAGQQRRRAADLAV